MTVASRGGLGTGESLQVLCVLGTGEGLTGCDGGQHGRAGHGESLQVLCVLYIVKGE